MFQILEKKGKLFFHDWTHKTTYWSAFPLFRVISPGAGPPSRLQSGMMTYQTQCSGCPEFHSVHLGNSDIFPLLSLFSCVSEVLLLYIPERRCKEGESLDCYIFGLIPSSGWKSKFALEIWRHSCYVLAYSGAIESARFECKQFGTMKYNSRVPDLNHYIKLALQLPTWRMFTWMHVFCAWKRWGVGLGVSVIPRRYHLPLFISYFFSVLRPYLYLPTAVPMSL